MAAPAAMPARIASGTFTFETMQTTIEVMPMIEPCEKSRPPIVMMKKTPVAAMSVT